MCLISFATLRYFFFAILLAYLRLKVLIIVVLTASLALVLFLATPLLTAIKKRKVEKEEYQETLVEGGIEETRPSRDLTEKEKTELTRLYRESKLIGENLVLIVIAFILIDLVLISLFLLNIPFLLFAIILEGTAISLGLKERSRYLDLRSPAFRVQGKAIKEKISGKRRDYYYLTIRKIKFSEENYKDLSNFYFTINDQDEVAVEYSPRTKHVWKMYKTQDLK